MQKKRFVPLNAFLAVAGVSLLFFFFTSRNAPASRETAQVQSMEQEKMAAVYFRVLSFLTDVMPGRQAAAPAPANRDCAASKVRIEPCRYWTGHDKPGDKCPNSLSSSLRRRS